LTPTAVAQLGPPDLVASGIDVAGTGIVPGSTKSVTTHVTNGGVEQAGATQARMVLSTSSSTPGIVGRTLLQFSIPSLVAEASNTQTVHVPIPLDLGPGTYYLWLVTDTNGVLAEVNEANNNSCSSAFTVVSGGHLVFDSIPGQQARVPFTVTIRAVDGAGTALTGLAGSIRLVGDASIAAPSLLMNNGVVTALVSVNSAFSGMRLVGEGVGLTGTSNTFDVTSQGTSATTLGGRVLGPLGVGYASAVVTWTPAVGSPRSATTNELGVFTIAGATCGAGIIRAEAGELSDARQLDLSCDRNHTTQLFLRTACNPLGQVPILLVPGILGSTTSPNLFTPMLGATKIPWDSWIWGAGWGQGLFNPLDRVGWVSLWQSLGLSQGCAVFAVPYDWRYPPDVIAKEYLVKRIDLAKQATGAAKVRIIAHSMGGLVVRAYLQGPDYQARLDVEKVAMVGTPNRGSPEAYGLYTGHVPLVDPSMGLIDLLAGNRLYERTLNALYSLVNPFDLRQRELYDYAVFPSTWNAAKARTFIRGNVFSIADLLPTYDFVDTNGDGVPDPSSLLNDSLRAKNAGLGSSVDEWWPGGCLALFGSHDVPTMDIYRVGGMRSQAYPVGQPLSVSRHAVGDGTVPWTSLQVPGLSALQLSNQPHSGLIKAFRESLVTFITAAGCSAPTAMVSGVAAQADDPLTADSHLSVEVDGASSVLVTDGSGWKIGFEPPDGILVAEIPDATIETSFGKFGITLPDPSGSFSIQVARSECRDVSVAISYADSTRSSSSFSQWYNCSPSEVSTFVVQPGTDPALIWQGRAGGPLGLKAEVGSEGRMTRLTWTAMGPAVNGYRVYRKGPLDFSFQPVATTMATSIDRPDPWGGDTGMDVVTYAVAAILAHDSETLFSLPVRNDDADADGLTDEEERVFGSDPDVADTDGDGLSDLTEQGIDTNPSVADSDSDGWTDHQEMQAGSDPLNTMSTTGPTPMITAATPNRAAKGPLTVTLTGAGFYPISRGRWNGSERASVYVSESELGVVLTAEDLSVPGFGSLSVENPAPGGGVSNEFSFTVDRTTTPMDFDGSHTSDLLWRHLTAGAMYLWPMEYGVPQPELYVGTVGTDWQIRSIADFTGDGQADLLWRHTNSGAMYLWPVQNGIPQPEAYVGTVPLTYEIVASGDFDGDQQADLLWRHVTQGDMWLWRMNGAALLGDPDYVDTVPPAYAVRGTGDLDGNGTADVVWQHTTGGDVWAWLMNGAAHQVDYVATVWDPGYQVRAVGDFTGDTKADILWHHVTQGTVYLWEMNGLKREKETWVTTVWDVNYQIAASGDYDGDARTDLVWRHVVNGNALVWLMDGAQVRSETPIGTVPISYQIVR
jgi:hypothetical protein